MLKFLKQNIKVWNKEVFGMLKSNIAKAEQLVLASQNSYDINPSDSLLVEMNTVKSILHNWLNAETVHWKQKAKVRWLQDGYRNTTFFHLSAKSRGTQNRIV